MDELLVKWIIGLAGTGAFSMFVGWTARSFAVREAREHADGLGERLKTANDEAMSAKGQLEKKQTEIQRNREEISTATQQLSALQASLDSQQEKLRLAHAQIADQDRAFHSVESDLRETRARVAGIQSELDDVHERWTQQETRLRELLSNLEADLRAANEARAGAANDLAAATESSNQWKAQSEANGSDLVCARNQLAELDARHNDLVQEQQALQTALAEADRVEVSLRADLAGRDDRIRDLESGKQAVTAEVADLTAAVAARAAQAEADRDSLRAELTDRVAESNALQQRLKEIEAERDALRTDSTDLAAVGDARVSEIRDLQARAAQTESERDSLRAELTDRVAESNTLQQRLKEIEELDALRAESTDLVAVGDVRVSEFRDLQARAAQAEAERDALRTELADLVAAGDARAAEVRELQASANSLKQEIEHIRQESIDLHKLAGSRSDEIEQLRERLSAVDVEGVGFRLALAEAQQNAGSLANELKTARERLDAHQAALNTADDDNTVLRTRAAEIEAQRDEALRDKHTLQARLEELESQVDGAQLAIGSSTLVTDSLRKEIAGLKQQLAVAAPGPAELVRENESHIAELTGRINEMDQEHREALRVREDIEASLRREVESVQTDLGAAQREIEILRGQIAGFEVERQSLSGHNGEPDEWKQKCQQAEAGVRDLENALRDKEQESREMTAAWDTLRAEFEASEKLQRDTASLLREKVVQLAGHASLLEADKQELLRELRSYRAEPPAMGLL